MGTASSRDAPGAEGKGGGKSFGPDFSAAWDVQSVPWVRAEAELSLPFLETPGASSSSSLAAFPKNSSQGRRGWRRELISAPEQGKEN